MEKKAELTLKKIIFAKTWQDVWRQLRGISKEQVFAVVRDDHLAKELQKQGIAVAVEELPGKRSGFSSVVQSVQELAYEDFLYLYQRQKGIPREILKTNRTRVREFCMGDLDALMELYAQPGIAKWTPGLQSYEEEAAYQKDYIRYMYGLVGYGMWLVLDKESGQLIGRAGIESNETCEAGEAELGYVIHPAFWNRGIATEVCRAILKYAGEEFGICRFFVRIKKENVSSLAVAEKLGIKKVILL